MLVHKFLMKAGSNIIVAVMSFISLMVMTRYVGNQYGLMMWGWSFVAIFNAVTDLGYNTASMKFISKNDSDRSACFSTFLFIKIVLSIFAFALTVLSLLILSGSEMMTEESMRICLIFMVYFLIYNTQTALTVTFDGLLMSTKSAISLAVESIVRSTLLILLALMGVDATTLSLAYLIGGAISFLITVVMMHKMHFKIRKPVLIKKYTIFAIPLMLSIMSIAIVEYLDKVILGFFQGSAEVGYYTAAAGVVGAFTTLGVSLNNVLLPHLSKNEGKKELERTVWKVEKYLSILLIPVLAFIMTLGPQIAVVLYGNDFAASGNMLSIQTIHIYTFILTGIMSQILYAMDKAKAYLRASLIFSIIAVIGFIILIPQNIGKIPLAGLGGVGAASALAASYTIFSIILIFVVKKEIGFKLYPKLWKLLFSGMCSGSFLLIYDHVLGISGLLELAIFGIISMGIFLGTLWIMKELNKEDIEFFKSTLSRKALASSIQEEWK